MPHRIKAYVDSHRQELLAPLLSLLRQPSISAQGLGIRECATLLGEVMASAGIDTRVLETAGFPVVYGEAPGPAGAPTLLVYGHYDVQPAEPLSAWITPPFEPDLRDGRVYARGAGDNKGQLLAHVLAVRAFRGTGTPLPVNVKFLFEGEEESGSPNLLEFVSRHRDLLQADLVVTSDGPKHETGRPILFFGLRGLLYVELIARGPNRDLHSGHYGGLAPNPAMALCRLLATLKHPDGRVAVEGFYDDVVKPTPYERELLAAIPFTEEEARRDLDVAELDRVGDLHGLEAVMFAPSLNVSGITSGYGGAGSKTVIPSLAVAKIDMRLAEAQNPDDIYDKVCRHVRRYAPGVEVRRAPGGSPPSKTSPELPASQAVIRAVRAASGAEPVLMPLLGASMPDYIFTKVLGVPSIGVPYANPDEHNHSPNENLRLEDYYDGIVTSGYILRELAGLPAKGRT
ncbi:MAG: M20/M25/M40 family metallo-hydrolase [Bacillota bacterium]|nr:M20/M25/M40 family metallo-hydrolase [Bacillota bacterium]